MPKIKVLPKSPPDNTYLIKAVALNAMAEKKIGKKELACLMGLSEATMYRWLRTPANEWRLKDIIQLYDVLEIPRLVLAKVVTNDV